MSIQAFGSNFNAQQTQLFDPQTGALTINGKNFLLALFNRTGGTTGIVPKVSPPLTATGISIADALPLTTDWNFFGTAAFGAGCIIMPLKPGNDIQVFNGSANPVAVYPPDAQSQIDALFAGTAYSLPAGKLRIFECWAINPGQFYSYGN